MAKYYRPYYAKNRRHVIGKTKEWKRRNPNRARAHALAYYYRHREKVLRKLRAKRKRGFAQ